MAVPALEFHVTRAFGTVVPGPVMPVPAPGVGIMRAVPAPVYSTMWPEEGVSPVMAATGAGTPVNAENAKFCVRFGVAIMCAPVPEMYSTICPAAGVKTSIAEMIAGTPVRAAQALDPPPPPPPGNATGAPVVASNARNNPFRRFTGGR
jgi:hypothetical protein